MKIKFRNYLENLKFIMKVIKTCVICGKEPSNEFNLGKFKLPMSIEKISSENKSKKYIDYKYNICKCESCNYFWMKYNHPSILGNNKSLKFYDLRIRSNEPENHFNKLKKWLLDLGVLENIDSFGLVSYKDNSLFEKIRKNNSTSSLIYDDIDILEISRNFKNNIIKSFSNCQSNKYDFIIARHVLEHISNPDLFLKELIRLIKNNGIIYFEMPSPLFMIEKGLSYYLWEEHPSYFSIKSLRKIFKNNYLNSCFAIFENGFEPIISVILTKNNLKNLEYKEFNFSDTNMSIENFRNKHIENKKKIRDYLINHNIKNLYFLGAGHLGIKLISFFDISKFIIGIIDDMQCKQNKISISTGLKIYSSNCLKEGSTILHALPIESEKKVKQNPTYSSHKLISINDIIF